jgi:hypothetical protein
METTGRSSKNSFDVGETTNELLAYCGIFAKGRNMKPAETAVAALQTAVARQRLSSDHVVTPTDTNAIMK